ncbi:MAG: PepSY domain-containing protein [Nitrospiraceae bacterium]
MKNVGLGLSIFTLLLGITLALNLPAWSEKAGEQEPGTVAPPEITMQEAIKAATEKVPGKVTEAELENEHGKTIFEITVVGEDGKEVEVEVDAATGVAMLEDEEEDEEKEKDTED